MKPSVYISSAGGVFGSAFLWLLSFKIVAYWLGPEGVGLFSQLRQIAQAATIGATFGGTNAVVQGLSERMDTQARWQFRGTASRLIGITGVLVVLFSLTFTQQLMQLFLSSGATDLLAAFRWLCLAILLNVGSTYVIAVLNGYRSYWHLALAQVAGPMALVITLASAYFLHVAYRPEILALSMVLCFLVTYLVGALGVSRLPKLASNISASYLTQSETRSFVKFAGSNLLAALSSTIALLLIRSWMIDIHGLAFAGLFDAAWTLTFNYITLFLTACSAIYLPLLAGATQPENQKVYMLKTTYLVLAGCTLVCYSMILFKNQLIHILYSQQFEDSGRVLTVLTIAVIFRGVSWVYGMMILATRNSRVLIISDLAFNLGLLLAARYSLQSFSSLESLGWAFVIPNFFYLVFVVEYARYKNIQIRRRQIWPLIIIATLPVILRAVYEEKNSILWGHPQFIFLSVGLLVSGWALFAYKKVTL
jgi:O-antigen/teichoic acid export membrane protein